MAQVKSRRWNYLNKVLSRGGPFVQADFDPSCGLQILKDMKILVVGAGGLGCELLKGLALMGFEDIHVVDCDTIDLSNLNRQFLFRTKDIGRSKAEVAAEFINTRVSGCKVVAHNCKIEDKNPEFYSQFNIIVVGLDAIEPRRWLNRTIFSLLEPTMDGALDGIIPMVDGGTEGFKGNARVIIPSQNFPCIDCNINLFPPRVTFPMCTLAQRPRLPEHCIEYIRLVEWTNQKPFGETVAVDGDDPAHIQWIFERSLDRAKEFGIEGVTYRLTQGVVKHIIPAVASTNAVIASICVTEVFKLATASAPILSNYLIFNDVDGIYTYTYAGERNPDCLVCSNLPQTLSISKSLTLQQLVNYLQEQFDMEGPLSLTASTDSEPQILYMPSLSELSDNLGKTLVELSLTSGQQLLASNRKLTKTFTFNFF